MHRKLGFLIASTFLVGSLLLVLRQQQFEEAHRLVRAHKQIDQAQRELWQLQVQIAGELQPQTLRRTIQTLPVEFEPIVEDILAADSTPSLLVASVTPAKPEPGVSQPASKKASPAKKSFKKPAESSHGQ
ncbi:MAG: hypothetical protein IT441_02455 [Phycisphaeraceae bacterium]|nr:hypothetical protein [Phycisphaeraceae bacterium]